MKKDNKHIFGHTRKKVKNTDIKMIIEVLSIIFALVVIIYAMYEVKSRQAVELPQQITASAPEEKPNEMEKYTKKAATKAQIIDENDNGDNSDVSGNSVKDESEEEYNNIESANDYVNFERLIMQISQFTDPGDDVSNSSSEISEENINENEPVSADIQE